MNDEHFELMENLVEERRMDLVRTLDFKPGTLSIFQGSKCLHRVTDCVGTKDRLVAVFAWASKPKVKNSPKVQEMFWGRIVN